MKIPKQMVTASFKAAAIQQIKDGKSIAKVTREQGISEQTLRNGIKAQASGKLNRAGLKPVTPDAPNQVFSPDITTIRTDEDFLKLSVVLDLFNREVVGWSIKSQMTADLVTDALTFDCFVVFSREHCAIRIEAVNMRVRHFRVSSTPTACTEK